MGRVRRHGTELEMIRPQDEEAPRGGEPREPVTRHVDHALRHAGEDRRDVVPDRRAEVGILPLMLGPETCLDASHSLSLAWGRPQFTRDEGPAAAPRWTFGVHPYSVL